MPASLPSDGQPGWGDVLNNWLLVSHNADGTPQGALSGFLAPKVTVLTDGATIPVNAALGNSFRVTLGGNRTVLSPTNAADGQSITFEVIQDATGSRTLTWTSGAGGFAFGSSTVPVLSTTAGATDLVAFRYSSAKGRWLFLGSSGGF